MRKGIASLRSRSRRKIWAKRRSKPKNSLQQRQEDPNCNLFGFLLKNSPKSKSSVPKKRIRVSPKRETRELLRRPKEMIPMPEQGKTQKATQTLRN